VYQHIRLVVIVSIVILLFQVGRGFSKMPYEQGMGQPGIRDHAPVVMGEVEKIGNKTLILMTRNGKKEELGLTSRTSFAREMSVTRDHLGIGDILFIVGQYSDEGTVNARIIKILDEGDDLISRQSSRPPSSEGLRGQRGSRVPERIGPRDRLQGPIVGKVTELEPLTIRLNSGKTIVNNVTDATKILKETVIDPSDINKGTNVRVIAPPKPGMGKREALKIIALGAERPIFRDEGPGFGRESRRTMEVIPAREISAVDFLDSPFGFLTAPPQPAYLFDLDVNWMVTGIRLASWEEIETQKGVYDFSSVDKRLGYLFKNGINTIIELRAINPIYGTQSGRRGVRGVSFPEQHLFEWGRFVEKFVERYDGDGINDAPGSPIVKNYQLIHELIIPMRMKGFWRENPDKYAKFFKVTYDAIKRSCDDCTLFFTGGFEEDFMFKGNNTLNGRVLNEDGFFVNVLREFHEQGIRLRNIGFDYHYWSNWLFDSKAGPETYRHHLIFINHIKKLYQNFGYTADSVSIISKESGVNGYLDKEREQAIYLIKAYVATIAAGQRHLFWTSVVEYPQEAPLFLGMGLIHNPVHHGYSHKKLAYYTYKLMVDKLKDSDWRNVETIVDGKDNIYIYKFPKRKGEGPIFIIWWDYFKEDGLKEKEVLLNFDITSSKVTITSTIPDAKNGQEIQDRASFKREIKDVRQGSISIILGHEPIFLEEGVMVQPLYQSKRINPAILDRLVE